MRRTLFLTIAVWLTATPAAAYGHMLPHTKPLAKMTPKQEYLYGVGTERHAQRAVSHYRLVVRWFDARRTETLNNRDPYRSFVATSAYEHARAMLRGHRWLVRLGERTKAEGWKRLHPRPPIPHKAGWLCIHSHEGSWTDSGDPYWGGLQMDRGFMETYGPDFIRRYKHIDGQGFANVWPDWVQMVAAERAFSGYGGHGGRGYGPWPNTARYCGLL